MKKNILFIYASYGSGHKTISNYVKDYFIKNGDYNILSIDLLDYCNLLGTLGLKAFNGTVNNNNSGLFSICYELLDHKLTKLGYKKFCLKSFDNDKLRNDIINFKPDLTISTHFFGSTIIEHYNSLKITNSKVLTIVTDYKSHKFWEIGYENQDAIIVGNDIVKSELIEKNIPSNKIYSYGIPLVFNVSKHKKSKAEIFLEYKLNKNYTTYLFFGGGSAGYMAYYDYLKKLLKNEHDINVIFICGKNEELKNKCDKLVRRGKYKNVKILGFVNDVYSLYNACDVVISKPGGATVTECLETKTPMILVPGVGGQENHNAKFMAKNGYGLVAKSPRKLCKIVNKFEKNNRTIIRIQNKINEVDKNDSVRKIFNLSIKLLKQKRPK